MRCSLQVGNCETFTPFLATLTQHSALDSSRFWSVEKYQVGKPQESIDKQVVRDWLIKEGLNGREDVELPNDVLAMTQARYKEAFRMLVEREWED